MKFFLISIFIIFSFQTKQNPSDYQQGIILLTFNEFYPDVPLKSISYSTGSNLSQKDQIEIQKQVGEFYKDFDVVITTDDSLFYTYPKDHRVRCVITSDPFLLVIPPYFYKLGGLSVYNALYLQDTTAAIVSTTNLENNSNYISIAIAHEVGHIIGLGHQSLYYKSSKIEEYNPGDSLVAPIMGVSYHSKISKWFTGTNNFGQYQDDVEIISKTFPKLKK